MVLHPEALDAASFSKIGSFVDLMTAADTYAGQPTDAGFFPDLLRLTNNGKDISISITKVNGTPETLTTAELHSDCCEGILPLDGDVYLCAAPPFWYLKLEESRLFRVPKGTFVKLKPGAIHSAPLSVTGAPVNVLILLPERTYSNDCQFMELTPDQQMTVAAE